MKVLHILQNYEPSKGGTQFLFKNVSEILVEKFNDEVLVYTTNSMFDPGNNTFKKVEPDFEVINKVRVYRFFFFRFHRSFLKNINKLHFKLFGRKSNYIARLRLGPWAPQLKNSLNRTSCDIICGSSSQYSFMNYGIWRKNFKIKNPFVFMGAIHFDDEKNISLPKHILNRINASDKYISNTIFEKECLTKLGVEPNKIDVIGCGVNIQEFGLTSKNQSREIIGLSESDFVVGYIGRFAVNKDIVTLIKAFGDNCKENWKLLLAGGENEYLNFLKSYVNENYQSLSDRIIFIVNFEDSLKEKLYACMDIFVCPSYSESFGIVFLEAWASKLPVIGTNIGAIRTIIEDNHNGRIFSVSNSSQLANLMNYYHKNIEIRITHGLAGFELVSRNFTWEIVARKYRNTYLEAIQIFNNNNKCVV